MHDDSEGCVPGVAVGVVATMLVLVIADCSGCGVRNTEREAQYERALEAGVGYWTIDPATGEAAFVYGVAPARAEGGQADG